MGDWHPADEPPDDDRNVLVHLGDGVHIEPHGDRVWLGYYSHQRSVWCDVSGGPHAVLAWREVPEPPEVSP